MERRMERGQGCPRSINAPASTESIPTMNFIDIKESAYMAIDTVRANKLRSLLTILGVSVGVVTVVFMVSIIQGLNKAFAQQIEALGSNAIWATKFDPSIGHQPTSEEI